MQRGFYTYIHCKPSGEPFYVGKGSALRGLKIYRRNPHHRNVVAKYGAANIKAYIFPCDSEREAFEDEVHQIAQLRSAGYELANLTYGGEGPTGRVFSLDTRSRMSMAHLGVKMAASTIAKRSATVRGRKHSPETIAKMSAAQSGKRHSEYTKAILSAMNKGKVPPRYVMTAEIRAKMSASAMGNKSASGKRRHAKVGD